MILSFLLSFILCPLLADDTKYAETMSKAIGQVYKAKAPEEIQQAVNTFERIGNAEKTKWEPFYYAAFGFIMMANQEQDGSRKDALLDQATSQLQKASELRPNDSEIVTLEGFVSTVRLTVDPATRGQQYSAAAMQSFGKALGLNPENPRAMGMMAQMQFGTARFFKSSTDEACATAMKARELFAAPKLAIDPLAPVWGKGMVEGMLANCK